MFYKALGYLVWNFGVAHLRRRYARRLKVVAGVAVVSLATAGYFATRSGE